MSEKPKITIHQLGPPVNYITIENCESTAEADALIATELAIRNNPQMAHAEIARLRAALAEAQQERDDLDQDAKVATLKGALFETERQRDEARADLAEAEKKLSVLEDSESCDAITLRTKLAEARKILKVAIDNEPHWFEHARAFLKRTMTKEPK